MRVLVTGGSGFIGGFVVEKLASRGATPVVLDLVPPRDLEVAPPYRQGDVRDPAVVERAVAGCHAVVHLAGILGTDLTVDCPRETVETNLLGTLHVLESARRHGCRAVLINVGNDWDNPYTITKQAAVRFGLMYAREFGMPVTVIRAMNGYGPRQKADHTRKLVPEPIRGQVEAATGRALTVNEVAERIRRLANPRVPIVHLPMRRGEPPRSRTVGDPLGAAQHFGYVPRTPVDEGLRRTVAWYRDRIALAAAALGR